MKSFFKSFFAALLALVVFFGLLFFLFVGLAAVLVSTETATLEKKTVLVLDLSKPFSDREIEDPFAELMDEKVQPDLYSTVQLIKKAQSDSMVAGIYVLAQGNSSGMASSEELRKALLSFKSSGKFIYAYADYMTQRAYAVAHIADKVYVHPMGAFEWQGMSVEYMFFKTLIDRLEIKPQIFYAGKFKSATEPFREKAMTPANKEQTSVWLNDVYNEMLASVSAVRKLHMDTLRNFAAQYRFDNPAKAVQAGMIDGIRYDDEVKDEIRAKLGAKAEDKIHFMDLSLYNKAVALSRGSSRDKIALVIAEGEIVYGKGNPDQIGSDEYLSLLRKIRNDKTVKALVLRVNSPGGSSLASEIIWREISLIKKKGIPVVVSMGDVAASGGYYIAAPAHKIFVGPNTITGSIGVFGIVPDFSTFMNNKLGITFDRVKTSAYADAPSVTRPMTEQEMEMIQMEIDRVYVDFKSRVAEGRKMNMESVDSVAQGRVWTGRRAITLGLADTVGGLQDALNEAAQLAGIKTYSLRTYPEKKSILDYILNQSPDKLSSVLLEKELGKEEYNLYKKIKSFKEESGSIKARMPFDFSLN